MDRFELGGNKFLVWVGGVIENIGEFLITKGKSISTGNKPKVVYNLSGKLVNAHTLIVSFTVGANDKYQVVLQGNYREKYKEMNEDGNIDLSDSQLFNLVSSQKEWFKKNFTDN